MIAAILVFSAAMSAFAQAPLRAPKQEKLLNGLKVLMWSDAQADKVSVKIRIHAGSAFDPQGKEGAMQLLADDLFPNDASREFFAEDLGGGLEVVTTYDFIQINAWSKPESFLTMLETLAAAVSNPAIDKDTTAKLRTALFAKLKVSESDPGYVADQAVAKRLFGTFPYGRPQRGSTTSVQKIDFADLIYAKQRFLTSDNATIAITGNFERDLGYRAVRRYFGSWLKSDKRVPATFRQPDSPDTSPLRIELPNFDKNYTRTAITAPARPDKDYVGMLVLTKIWKEQFAYSDIDEQSCGRPYYQANLLRGTYRVATARKSTGDLFLGRNICIFLGKDADGRYSYPEIKQSDFDKAKAKTVSEFNDLIQSPPGLSNLWLDLDTFKLQSVDDETRKINAVNLADIIQLVDRFRKSPMVTVLVTSSGTNN